MLLIIKNRLEINKYFFVNPSKQHACEYDVLPLHYHVKCFFIPYVKTHVCKNKKLQGNKTLTASLTFVQFREKTDGARTNLLYLISHILLSIIINPSVNPGEYLKKIVLSTLQVVINTKQ